jgi:hypothetical protein
MERPASLSGAKRELERAQQDKQKVIEAIKGGFPLPELKPEAEALRTRRRTMKRLRFHCRSSTARRRRRI